MFILDFVCLCCILFLPLYLVWLQPAGKKDLVKSVKSVCKKFETKIIDHLPVKSAIGYGKCIKKKKFRNCKKGERETDR